MDRPERTDEFRLWEHSSNCVKTSTFARSLSVMLESGITLIDGLGTVEKLLYNRFTAKTVNNARASIIQGGNFADAIDIGNAFAPMLKKMVSVGQQSGDLKGVLEEVAEFHEAQFHTSIKRLNSILTPLLTIGIGGVVGYVYISFFVALLAAGQLTSASARTKHTFTNPTL